MNTIDNLSPSEYLQADYDGKVSLLERVTAEMLGLRVEYAELSGRLAELKANLEVLKQVKSALQSSLRAERES